MQRPLDNYYAIYLTFDRTIIRHMPLVLNEPSWDDLLKEAKKSVHQLVLIVGPTGSGKTAMLNDICSYNFTSVNLGLELSRNLMSISHEKSAIEAEDMALSIIESKNPTRLALDNTEILFEQPMQLNPLTFFKRISQQRLTVATWNGFYEPNKLCYGKNGCPGYREFIYTEEDTFLVAPTIPDSR